MRRWMAVGAALALCVAGVAGCTSDAEKAAGAKKQVLAAVKGLAGVESLDVRTGKARDGILVHADVAIRPATGNVATAVKQLRAALMRADGVSALTLMLVVRRGSAEHDGRWYDGTAARDAFDRQADMWGQTIDSGSFHRVLAMQQSTTQFMVSVQGWDGAAAARPAATAVYRNLVAAGAAAGMTADRLTLSAHPTEQMQVDSNGGAALTEPVLVAADQLAKLDGVTAVTASGGPSAPRLRFRVYPRGTSLTSAQRDRVLGTLRSAGVLTADLQVRAGNGPVIWP
ncbi:hypothetical protein [Micromonospora sp. NPDC049107]|uniref:hypothetical protein n=1 Tax=unclassified Micromonospora TaxID=2617518 RepID=UPI0033C307EC